MLYIMRMLLLFVLAYCSRSHAQDSTILIRAGKTFHESVSVTDIYQYPQFVVGKVFFKQGDSTTAKLNYHKFLNDMQFIDFKGDTLNIINAATIRLVRINNDVFYYDNGYVKLIKETNGIKFASKETLRLLGKSKIGAYDMANPTSAIDSYGTLIDQRGIFNLVPREDITLAKKTLYYIGDKFNRFLLANRKNIHDQFSKQGGALKAYFKENNVNFDNREDLEKLLQFLAGL